MTQESFLNFDDDFWGMVINLSNHVLCYRIGDLVGKLSKFSYNIFYIPKGPVVLMVPEGETKLCFLQYSLGFLEMIQEEPVIASFLDAPARAKTMTIRSEPLLYHMLQDVAELMTDKTSPGRLRSLWLENSAKLLLIAAVNRRGRCDLEQIPEQDIATIQDIYEYLVNNLRLVKRFRTLAFKANMDVQTFRHFFRTVFCEEVEDVITMERNEKALPLLRCSELNMKEMAAYLGYSSLTRYVRAFKHRFGMHPEEFRKEWGPIGGGFGL